MVKIIKCENGHYYDPSKYSNCPFCDTVSDKEEHDTSLVSELARAVGDDTIILSRPEENNVSEMFTDIPAPSSSEENPRIVQADSPRERIVGWLVPLGGNHEGIEFRLIEGNNRIGKGIYADLPLEEASHDGVYANFAFDRKNKQFLIVPGQYEVLVNDEILTDIMVISSEVKIQIEDQLFTLIPFCNAGRLWN